jgi:hypothetical protein
VIINFHFLERQAFPAYRQALKPGAVIFIETFVKTRPDIADAAYYLEPGELLAAFRITKQFYMKKKAFHLGAATCNATWPGWSPGNREDHRKESRPLLRSAQNQAPPGRCASSPPYSLHLLAVIIACMVQFTA